MSEKTKVIQIKEEFVALTGDFKSAALLHKLLWWQSFMFQMDKDIMEEVKFLRDQGQENLAKRKEETLTHGWFFKQYNQMEKEMMGFIKKSTAEEKMKTLIKEKWVLVKRSDKKTDKKNYYKMNIEKIQEDLHKLGYVLNGYKLSISENRTTENTSEDPSLSISENRTISSENRTYSNDISNGKDLNNILSKDNISAKAEKVIDFIEKEIKGEKIKMMLLHKKDLLHLFSLSEKTKTIGSAVRAVAAIFAKKSFWKNKRNYITFQKIMVTLWNEHKTLLTEEQWIELDVILEHKDVDPANVIRKLIKMKNDGITFEFDGSFRLYIEEIKREKVGFRQGMAQEKYGKKTTEQTPTRKTTVSDESEFLS